VSASIRAVGLIVKSADLREA